MDESELSAVMVEGEMYAKMLREKLLMSKIYGGGVVNFWVIAESDIMLWIKHQNQQI